MRNVLFETSRSNAAVSPARARDSRDKLSASSKGSGGGGMAHSGAAVNRLPSEEAAPAGRGLGSSTLHTRRHPKRARCGLGKGIAPILAGAGDPVAIAYFLVDIVRF